MDKNAQLAYRNQQILTSAPAQLVAMLYDKAITSLKEAIHAIEENDIERRWKANKRAFEIISHLSSTLDMEQGGEIAKHLDRLYGFMLSRLSFVDLRNDPAPALEVIQLLEPLRRSWRELMNQGVNPQELPAGVVKDAPGKDAGANTKDAPASRITISA
jgi:flagellar protein FliS